MKKKLKKQIKAKKAVKKALSPIDRLSTTVANHNTLLFHIHQALMTEKIMPYQPATAAMDVVTQEAKEYPLVYPGGKNPPSFVSTNSGRGEIKYYTVSAKIQQTTLGHLTLDGQWTFDPALIGKFETKDRIPGPMQKAPLPEGAKIHVEEHRQ